MQPATDATATVPRHYLRSGRVQRSITRLITLDTETTWTDHHGFQDHELRVWVARLDVRKREHYPVSSAEYAYGTDRASIADQVEAWTRTAATTWLYAHNLSFDATVTDLPQELTRRGWTMTASNIIDSPVWFRFAKGSRRLVLADSFGIWPTSLAQIATDMGEQKAVLPDNTDTDLAGWWQRCEVDVTILANALLRALNWWDEQQLGRWSITGAGSGWSAFKTNFLTHRILIDIDPDAMDREKRSVYGGRREAFRLGEFTSGEFVDLDFRAAYPSIVASHDIPVRRLARFDHMSVEAHQHRRITRGVIAECDVITAHPVVPVRYGESIFYPTGHFRTHLASPEIDLVESTGGHVSIRAGHSYELAPAMAAWGQWVRALSVDHEGQVDPVVRRMAKHWSRAVIGRWTMQLSRRVPLPGFPVNGQAVTRSEWLDYAPEDTFVRDGISFTRPGAVPTKRTKGYSILWGDEYFALKQDLWPDNGFPAIWAWVESWCRVRLWEAMAARPAGSVWQCDTDGFLLGRVGRHHRGPRLPDRDTEVENRPTHHLGLHSEGPASVAGLELVEKGRYSSARILGPQHTVLGDQRRFPGVPRDAVETAPNTFQAQTWPGFLAQLETAPPGVFRRGSVTLKIGAGMNPRWVLSSGRTLPVEMELVDGRNAILPPPRRTAGRGPVNLADHQHSVLSRVRHS